MQTDRKRRLVIGDVLRRAAEATPDAPAAAVGTVEQGFATRTYAELERDANRLAHALRSELGVGRGDRIVVWADTSIEVLPLFVASRSSGPSSRRSTRGSGPGRPARSRRSRAERC